MAKQLSEKDELTEWESEFTESLSERLDEFGSAFKDPEKGGRGEALSYAQKSIVNQLKRKAKGDGMRRSGFKSKTPKFTPRVRQLNDDIETSPSETPRSVEHPAKQQSEPSHSRPPVGKPFLRIVKNDDE